MAVVNKTSSAVPAVAVNAKPKAAKKALVPNLPEQKKIAGDKRKRLSKAFLRPLDKKFKRGAVVRDCFSFPEIEYEHLVALKRRLLADGIEIKKSELLRAGLALLVSLDDDELKSLLAKVPRQA